MKLPELRMMENMGLDIVERDEEIAKSTVLNYSDVHVSTPLTNISIAYIQGNEVFVADRAFPEVPVQNQANSYYEYDVGEFSTDEVEARAPNTQTQGTTLKPSTDSYNCRVYGLHIDIPDEIRMNADSQVSLDRAVTIALTQRAMIKKERQWMSDFFQTGVWNTSGGGDTTPGVGAKWDTVGVNPIPAIRTGARTMLENTGFRPNIALIGAKLTDVLLDHPNIVGRFDRGQTPGGAADPAMVQLASLLRLEAMHPIEGIYNTADLDAAAAMDFVADDDSMLLLHRPSAPSLMTPSCGYTFQWTRYTRANRRGMRVRKIRMEPTQADRLELLMAYDMKQTGTPLGHFFNNTLT